MNYNFYDNLNNFGNFMTNLDDDNDNIQESNSLNLYEPLEGYVRGNLFKNLYEPYKNYRPQRLKINNEKEELMASIGEYSFAAHELNLYLDVNPNDQNALNLFNQYRKQANDLMMKYERKYGPLNVTSTEDKKIPFAWEASVWPWEV